MKLSPETREVGKKKSLLPGSLVSDHLGHCTEELSRLLTLLSSVLEALALKSLLPLLLLCNELLLELLLL